MKVSEDLYYKLVENKIRLKSPYDTVTDEEWRQRILASLYLVNNNKGILEYYPKKRINYEVKLKNPTENIGFTIYK